MFAKHVPHRVFLYLCNKLGMIDIMLQLEGVLNFLFS